MIAVDDPVAARHGDAEWLSLALIDARNRALRWLAAFEEPQVAVVPGVPAPLWQAARAGWWLEYWISRNVQAQRGDACDPTLPRLTSIEPAIDRVFMADVRDATLLPAPDVVRAYLTDAIEGVLDLLRGAGDSDAALYFYRLGLLHEDRTAETLAALAQAAQIADAPWVAQPSRAAREALWLPAQRADIGAAPGGLVCANERWAHAVELPAFEIDAQVVDWTRFVEFAEDGGYADDRWWSAEGWAWVQQSPQRAPGGVEQLRGGALVRRRGAVQRAGAHQAVVHVTRHEAQAWCAWAGRRLPLEAEWELAACSAAGRGFVWGDVLEWVAGSARAWPGHQPLPGDLDPLTGGAAVQRGAAWLSSTRLRQPRARRFVAAADGLGFCGFRSCAL